MGPSFKLCQLVLKKDVVPTIFNFPSWKVASSQLEKSNENQVNIAHVTAGECIGHFPSKISFVFKSKTFPKDETLINAEILMQQCSRQ